MSTSALFKRFVGSEPGYEIRTPQPTVIRQEVPVSRVSVDRPYVASTPRFRRGYQEAAPVKVMVIERGKLVGWTTL